MRSRYSISPNCTAAVESRSGRGQIKPTPLLSAHLLAGFDPRVESFAAERLFFALLG